MYIWLDYAYRETLVDEVIAQQKFCPIIKVSSQKSSGDISSLFCSKENEIGSMILRSVMFCEVAANQ